jgi:two-component system, NtrC family, sensor kinase
VGQGRAAATVPLHDPRRKLRPGTGLWRHGACLDATELVGLMHLTRKLVLALLLGVFAVVVAFSISRIRREIALFDGDMRRDHRTIGLTAAAAVSKNHGAGGDAVELVRRVDASRDNVSIRFVSLAGNAAYELAPAMRLGPSQRPAAGRWAHFVSDVDRGKGKEPSLVTYVAAPVAGHQDGAIQLIESLAPRAAYVRQSLLSVVVSSLAMVLVCGLIAVLVGARLVAAPVSKLIKAAREIGSGNFEFPINLKQNDELGELGRAIEAMSRQLAAMARAMRDETEARIRALEQLQHAERLTTLGQMASVLAHEIGTPLNVISGHAKMIGTGRTSQELLKEAAQTIAAQCERMTQIVRRILDYARPKRARRAVVPVNDVVRSAIEMLVPLAKQRAVDIRYNPEQSDAQALVDPAQIAQAITNILMNAIQASPPNSAVQVGLEAGPADRDGFKTVAITVQDEGHGIPEKVCPHVFEPFFTTKSPGEGTGLGLSIVRDIVEDHGGRAAVEHSSENGTVMSIILPRYAEPCPVES